MDHREVMMKRIKDIRLSLYVRWKRIILGGVTYYWFGCVLFGTWLEE